MGLKPDIGLKGNDYQWLGSMFYFGTLRAVVLTKSWELTEA